MKETALMGGRDAIRISLKNMDVAMITVRSNGNVATPCDQSRPAVCFFDMGRMYSNKHVSECCLNTNIHRWDDDSGVVRAGLVIGEQLPRAGSGGPACCTLMDVCEGCRKVAAGQES